MRRGVWSMAGCVFGVGVKYNRLLVPLTVQQSDLFLPMIGAFPRWTVPLWLVERDCRSKVLGSDEIPSFDSIATWFPQTAEALLEGVQHDKTLILTHVEFTKEFMWARKGY